MSQYSGPQGRGARRKRRITKMMDAFDRQRADARGNCIADPNEMLIPEIRGTL